MRPSDLIDPVAPAEGPPPRELTGFVLWCLRGALPVLLVALFVGGILIQPLRAWMYPSSRIECETTSKADGSRETTCIHRAQTLEEGFRQGATVGE